MTDWPKLIRELREQGISDWKIAQAIGYNHPKEVQAIAGEALTGPRIPRHDIGERLIALHDLLCVPKGGMRPIGLVPRETMT